jgi:hypothetical protein
MVHIVRSVRETDQGREVVHLPLDTNRNRTLVRLLLVLIVLISLGCTHVLEVLAPRSVGILVGYEIHAISTNRVNSLVVQRLISQLRSKGYEAEFLAEKPRKWALFDNAWDLGTGSEVYERLLKVYDLDEEAPRRFDAVLFFEYLVEPMDRGDRPLTRLRPNTTKGRIFLYDTFSGRRLFSDTVQRAYPFGGKTVQAAVETITSLDSLPNAAK